jgi:FKBP-type peptidyl-prolyl cis-trans isomerase SlyD
MLLWHSACQIPSFFELISRRDKTLKIEAEAVVSFHYTLLSEAGEELESSRPGEPSVYLHGANNVIQGLESAMVGRAAGDVFSATLLPEEAYGTHNPEKVQRVPVKHLVHKGKLQAGKVAQLNTRDGMRAVTVLKVGRHSADIDTNHPLAGQALTFDIEILDVRPATAEEIAHGHAHGPGGHQH